MVRIEVPSAQVAERQITSKKDGKNYVFREQQGYAYLMQPNGQPEPHPRPFSLPLEPQQQPYPQGNYTIDPASIYVNRYGKLEIGRLRLRPVAVGAPKTGTGS